MNNQFTMQKKNELADILTEHIESSTMELLISSDYYIEQKRNNAIREIQDTRKIARHQIKVSMDRLWKNNPKRRKQPTKHSVRNDTLVKQYSTWNAPFNFS